MAVINIGGHMPDGVRVEVHSFLGMSRGASLHIRMNNKDFAFQMSNRGHEIGDYASAQDFCEAIQKLRLP